MRKTIPKAIQLKIWNRDHWTCRYCGEAIFFSPTLKLLNTISPGHGYYHKNGKSNAMIDIFQWKWASVDHVHPHAKGGLDSEENYVSACWQCNLSYRDGLDKLQPTAMNTSAVETNWDGLSSLYLELQTEIDEWVALLTEPARKLKR